MGYIGKFPTAVPITTSDLADGIVTTSKLANDSVNASKFDETDNYAFTGTVTGTPAGLVKTGSLVSTTDAGSYSLDNCFNSTYLNYFVTFKFAIATDTNNCRFRLRAGGSTRTDTLYNAFIRYGDNTAGTGTFNHSYDDYINIGTDLEATDTKAIQGYMYIFSPYSSSYITNMTVHYNSITTGGYRRMHYGGMQFDSTISLDGFQLTQNTGNGSLADIQCWGIKE